MDKKTINKCNNPNTPIDIVLPWVNGDDPKWQEEKSKYDNMHINSNIRFQSWDNLQFIFRGIEKFMPWVHKIFFITWGHLPEWLDTSNEKLQIVKHSEYIPLQYLPTFNSNVIEMNYFRIEDLSENFILFNDDLFPLKPIAETYYFRNNLPCEEAVETHFILEGTSEMERQMIYACVNNMVIINRNFDKKEVLAANKEKWFNSVYGSRLQHNLNLQYWHHFESFVYPHEAMPMKKSVLKEIWQREPEMLNTASQNRIRAYSDVTQRLISMWQICSGKFVPHKYEGRLFLIDNQNYKEAVKMIRNQACPIISLNERSIEGFDEIKKAIRDALDEILPSKSSFEI